MKDFFILSSKFFIVSLIVVVLFIYALKSLDNSVKDIEVKQETFNKELTIEEIQKNSSYDYDMKFLPCISSGKDKEECNKKILKIYNHKSNIEIDSTVKNEKGQILIYIIYLLLIIVLNFQLTLYFYSKKMKEKTLNEKFFHISDWSINSAPILGVLGTISAFALLVGNSQTHEISELFGKAFFDAAITTLLGGFIYIFNLWLNVYIQPKIKI